MPYSLRQARCGWLAIATLATGCDDRAAESGTISVAANSVEVPAPPALTRPMPSPSVMTPQQIAEIIKHDRIERGVSAPPPAPDQSPLPLRSTARPFISPPLPPELLDDGGLKPLPTRQARPTGTPQ